MKIWRVDIIAPAIMFMIGLGLCLASLVGSATKTELDPDRARFMIECTYDWSLSPQTCRDILNGEDPPVPPPEYEGC